MLANLQKYNKAIAAAIGLLVIFLGPDFLNLTANTEQTTQTVLGLLTVFGVYQVTNKA